MLKSTWVTLECPLFYNKIYLESTVRAPIEAPAFIFRYDFFWGASNRIQAPGACIGEFSTLGLFCDGPDRRHCTVRMKKFQRKFFGHPLYPYTF